MIETLHILVVEDDPDIRDAVAFTLETAGHIVTAVGDGPAALAQLDRSAFNLVVSDLRMQPMDGLQLLDAIRAGHPQLPVMLMTAYGDVGTAVAAMRAGACDFLLKPFEPAVLLEQVRRYAIAAPDESEMIAEDGRTREVLSLAARVAETDATVLLTGESGTGKEVFARYIHRHSRRAAGPFVAINCAAIPETLLEATLFGYEKGAFTGAQTAQAGKFEQADGGTLLLDEISEMPLPLQAKLLRVLQEREVERVGGKKPIALDIRVLATSNRDMLKEVQAGRFREDLYYRLNVFPIAIPSLRERPRDIAALATHFLQRHSERIGKVARLSPEAAAILAAWYWPGNVRELENTLQRAAILARGDTVEAADMRLCLPQMGAQAEATAPPEANLLLVESDEKPSNMRDLEKQHILETLKSVGGSRKLAVEKLGISERTLRYKLQQYRAEGADV
ncbi:sigma-54-dependent response regulator transcription factor FleR [Niveibacterium umoris]|uniref:Two-component system response regulator FlrC n=1 Tax=Niveibacterium umoris TaxID=1193620 RepID=A0A840BDI5_9RHOO|nr:sigma-54 dependent transcriptional regulator [Niveibacterium umoris]MBB4011155.1 two-component system response regulator FlrC [Niveibacterium umoris]